MASHASLDAAAQERKARLAHLKSLKRKAPEPDPEAADPDPDPTSTSTSSSNNAALEPSADAAPSNPYLSGRNYDPATRGPKLGFEHNPAANASTAESRAAALADAAAAEQKKAAEEEEEATQQQLDLFKLQPKKPNWDLKRDVERRMRGLDVQLENAIARLVRERVAGQRRKEEGAANGGEDGNGAGGAMKGEELVTALHAREAEEAEEERREREEEEVEEGFT